MLFSTKSIYKLKILVYLAVYENKKKITTQEIAFEFGIGEKYIDNLMDELEFEGYINGKNEKEIHLEKDAAEIKADEFIDYKNSYLFNFQNMSEIKMEIDSIFQEFVLKDINKSVKKAAENITVAVLAEKYTDIYGKMYYI